MSVEKQTIVEPLAKFHARLDKEGRVAIPKAIRDALKLSKNDYVEVVVRKIEIDTERRQIKVLRQAYLITRIGSKGLIFLPSDLKKQFDLHEKDIVEIVLYGFHKFDELVSDKGKQLLNKMQSAGKWAELRPGQSPPKIESMEYFSYVFV
ncbi:MAG: AbrB/MazE/SpoVT family DNA-binding domain-containing protein [Thermococcus sp.]|uniref:AbrB/MazE/SpoVT family DNA-binding domain-containing protein n=1 Tax=Thermococcus sp. TaxID=35749 RepID=UPI001D58AD3F|nr:AbrB/MazE/SpoVT family DNA-binding domain-containing protein [Thermococcus sp.]MBO8175210.1 AbrB/MazE/SpoVT family DNA-binding domain-containing protein [Thermococcus sp.]